MDDQPIVKSNYSLKTFWEHFAELRRGIIFTAVAVIAFSLVAHVYHKEIITILFAPLGNAEPIFLSPLDPLIFILKVDFIVGIIAALPVIIFLIFWFITPAFEIGRRVLIGWSLVVSLALIGAAILYSYMVLTPLTLSFLGSIVVPGAQTMITAQNYLNFFFVQLLLAIVISQIPILVVSLTRGGIITPHELSRQRKTLYFGAIVTLSILTPTTDIFTLLTLLGPTVIMFEGSLVVATYFQSKKTK